MSAGSTMQQWSDRSNSAAHRRYPPHLQIPRLQTTNETPRHAILNPEADSAANVATDNEAKQRQLVEAGYKHGEGAPALLALELPHFSCVPPSPSTASSGPSSRPRLLFSEVVNNLIGLVPYHSWRISHRKHHSNTGSCKIDEVFVPMTRFVLASSWNETLEDSPLYQLYRIAFMLVVGWMTGYLFVNATGPTKYWVAEPLQPELGHLRRPQVLDDRAERHLPRSHAARAGRARAHLLPPL
ncbi:hypothetical protein PF008_g30084 [Phytophthora fragariae]|uniref:Fatty acid desaturase domain-containing protein n=1 Tax=Phytophthora fragariae TaxID=53985 RepID=A0A6G0Q724_9STRA|nr:hypothetical protein PF008_g30084 [Phytophthora fragariae]